jgi:hypothetical protein
MAGRNEFRRAILAATDKMLGTHDILKEKIYDYIHNKLDVFVAIDKTFKDKFYNEIRAKFNAVYNKLNDVRTATENKYIYSQSRDYAYDAGIKYEETTYPSVVTVLFQPIITTLKTGLCKEYGACDHADSILANFMEQFNDLKARIHGVIKQLINNLQIGGNLYTKNEQALINRTVYDVDQFIAYKDTIVIEPDLGRVNYIQTLFNNAYEGLNKLAFIKEQIAQQGAQKNLNRQRRQQANAYIKYIKNSPTTVKSIDELKTISPTYDALVQLYASLPSHNQREIYDNVNKSREIALKAAEAAAAYAAQQQQAAYAAQQQQAAYAAQQQQAAYAAQQAAYAAQQPQQAAYAAHQAPDNNNNNMKGRGGSRYRKNHKRLKQIKKTHKQHKQRKQRKATNRRKHYK